MNSSVYSQARDANVYMQGNGERGTHWLLPLFNSYVITQ